MAPKPFWKGYLKFSLVTCSIAMIPATTENEKVRFHILSRKTGNRVISQYVDEQSGKPIDDDRKAKAYLRGEQDYVLLEDDELELVKLESTRTIDIDIFAPAHSIEWIWCDRPHFLLPDDPVGVEAFSVIREAMELTKTVGVSRLVMYGRERAVMLEPRNNGIVLWTLRYAEEVRNPVNYFSEIAHHEIDRSLMSLMSKFIQERIRPWSLELVHDPVQAQLLETISGKQKRRKNLVAPQKEPQTTGANIVNIMDALKKSIQSETNSKRPR